MQATIILTYRAGESPDRHANLLAVLASLAQEGSHEVLIVEQDALPTLTGPLPHPRCRTLFAYNPGPFNKSWGFNIGARHSERPVLVFSDADVLVPGALDKSIAHCAQAYQVVKPYRRIVDLSPEQTAQVRAGAIDGLTLDATTGREGQGEFVVLCGGVFVLRAAALRLLGGWDERFRGWGGEDDAMSYAVQRHRLSTLEFDERPALHLWHPRAETQSHVHYDDNRQLAARYPRYTEAEMTRLAEVNRQAMGHLHKYRPTP